MDKSLILFTEDGRKEIVKRKPNYSPAERGFLEMTEGIPVNDIHALDLVILDAERKLKAVHEAALLEEKKKLDAANTLLDKTEGDLIEALKAVQDHQLNSASGWIMNMYTELQRIRKRAGRELPKSP